MGPAVDSCATQRAHAFKAPASIRNVASAHATQQARQPSPTNHCTDMRDSIRASAGPIDVGSQPPSSSPPARPTRQLTSTHIRDYDRNGLSCRGSGCRCPVDVGARSTPVYTPKPTAWCCATLTITCERIPWIDPQARVMCRFPRFVCQANQRDLASVSLGSRGEVERGLPGGSRGP